MYTPPYPVRPLQPASSLGLLRLARKNVIAIWPAFTFEIETFSYRVFKRTVHVVTTPSAVRQVFVDGGTTYERKSSQQRNALAPLIGDGLFISDGPTWRSRRRVVAPTTHVSRLADLAPAISASAMALRADWLAEANRADKAREPAEVDALAAMAELTAGIICASIFGRQLARAATRNLVEAFGTYQTLINQIDIVSFLGLPDILPRFQGVRIHLAARRIHRVLDRLIEDIMKNTTREASLLRSMADATSAGEAPAMDRLALRNEAAVLFMAGHETTANTLAWAWFILSQDSETERRLHEEVDRVLGDTPAGFADYENLPFTRAIIEETLRLYPPVPLQARVAASDATIGEKVVKKGDLVMLNAWILHRHAKVWTDPDAFVPDRFLPDGGGAPSRYAYVPFSIGPRVCTGAAFGLMEAVLCLATLARQLRLRLRPGWVVEPKCRLSLRPGERLPMIIERRFP